MNDLKKGFYDGAEYIHRLEEKNKRLQATVDAQRQSDMYRNEPIFRQVVDMLYNFLLSGQLSVLELRGALTLAANRFWMREERDMQFIVAREVDSTPFRETAHQPEKP